MIKTIEKFCYEKRLRFAHGTEDGMRTFFERDTNGVYVILGRPRVGLYEGDVVLRGNAVQYRDELAAMLGRNGNSVTKVSDNRLHVVFHNVRILSCGYNDIPNFPKYLCFKAGSGGGTVSMVSDLATKPTLQYSVDQIVWYDMVVDSAGGDSDVLDLAADEKVYLRGTNNAFSDGTNHSIFVMTGTIYGSGNINTILVNDDIDDVTMPSNCYRNLFYNCTSLVTAPEFPSTTLAYSCYYNTFFNCSSLVTAPELPATTLANNCYFAMFFGCSSLTTAPELPSKTLANACYQAMFRDCTSLVTAPKLEAPILPVNAYCFMFYSCPISEIICLATDITASDCTLNWVVGVAATGTFTKAASMTGWTTGNSGIPSGWTVEDYA